MIFSWETLLYAIFIVLGLIIDAYYGSGVSLGLFQTISDISNQLFSDNLLVFLSLLALFAVLAIYLYMQYIKKEIVKLNCTPKVSPAEFDYHMKRTTIEKITELKNSPEYKRFIEQNEARNRDEAGERRSNSQRGSYRELNGDMRSSQHTYVNPSYIRDRQTGREEGDRQSHSRASVPKD
jgi:hypothetical protein